jgi:hypothetical protein
MILVRLAWFFDFMQVLKSTREHYTKNKYFPKHILFIVIYLLVNKYFNT